MVQTQEVIVPPSELSSRKSVEFGSVEWFFRWHLTWVSWTTTSNKQDKKKSMEATKFGKFSNWVEGFTIKVSLSWLCFLLQIDGYNRKLFQWKFFESSSHLSYWSDKNDSWLHDPLISTQSVKLCWISPNNFKIFNNSKFFDWKPKVQIDIHKAFAQPMSLKIVFKNDLKSESPMKTSAFLFRKCYSYYTRIQKKKSSKSSNSWENPKIAKPFTNFV
jgi:hypothetical protein